MFSSIVNIPMITIDYSYTGAWSGTDTLANCTKVDHDKIWEHIQKLKKERKKS